MVTFQARTLVVDGSLALHMQRLAAARSGVVGLQVMTLPQLAARLAGGFARPASVTDLELASRTALSAGALSELGAQADLPGMTRALVRTLDRIWSADVPLDTQAHPRLADLGLLDSRVRQALGPGVLVPPDLVHRALKRRPLFARLVGEIRLARMTFVAPVWRPLIEALAETIPMRWVNCALPTGWAAGEAEPAFAAAAPAIEFFTAAHPQAEAIEALRWARALVANGMARPEDIAIVAASPETWDDSFLGLANGAGLPLHFSHGIPALCTRDGQACGALADLLAQGLSFGRVQRLLAHSGNRCSLLASLPPQPLAGVPAHAALTTVDQWRRALTSARSERPDRADVAAALMPMLELVGQGLPVAASAGTQLLPRGAAVLWQMAVDRAPLEALPFTLSGLRVADGRSPGASIVWGPAAHLVGAPRAWMRLIGMTSRGWPRPRRDDPLLPDHILALDPVASPSRPELDRRAFAALCAGATSGLSFSYARRAPLGGAQAPSPLLPPHVEPVHLARLRTPAHAYSEADRLLARPQEKSDVPRLAAPVACVRGRRSPQLTAWDGLLRADHPVILATLAEVQSPASLRLLLRDPQAFTWRYGLGWRATLVEAQTLALDDRAFGELVHELLQYTVAGLEQGPGFARAADYQIEEAVSAAKGRVFADWPTRRPTPPRLLFQHLLDKAAELALTALKLDGSFQPGTRSWTEVSFGDIAASSTEPWDTSARVIVPGTELAIRGRIDRVEIAVGDSAVRVTDYKTSRSPANAATCILGGGAELQRVLYSVAARRHVPDASLHAHIVYLGDDAPRRFKIKDVEAAIARAAQLLGMGTELLRRGISLPGPDARERWSDFRLARPAAGEPDAKEPAIAAAVGRFAAVWSER